MFTVIATKDQSGGIYNTGGQRFMAVSKQTSSLGYAFRLGLFTAINPTRTKSSLSLHQHFLVYTHREFIWVSTLTHTLTCLAQLSILCTLSECTHNKVVLDHSAVLQAQRIHSLIVTTLQCPNNCKNIR